LAYIADQSRSGDDVNECSSVLCFEKGGGGTRDEKTSVQMHIDDGAPIILTHVHEQSIAKDAGIVYDRIDASKRVEGGLNDTVRALPARNAIRARDRLATRSNNFFHDPLRRLRVASIPGKACADVIDHDLRTLRGHGQGKLAANATAGTRN
jgi:hypothetical protein